MSNASAWAGSEPVSVAVAVKHGSNSKWAVEWVLDQLASEGETITLIHVRCPIRAVPTPLGGYIPIAQVTEEAAAAYRKQVEAKTEQMLTPHRRLCERKQVQTETMILEEANVPDAIVKYISESGISNLVMGSPSRNALSRRIVPDVPAIVAKNAPKQCTLYVISKGKLSYVKSTVSSTSTSSSQEDVPRISSSEWGVSNSSSSSNKIQPIDADDNESQMVQPLHRRLSLRNPVVSGNIFKSENADFHAPKLTRSQSSKVGVCENSTSEKKRSPVMFTVTKLLKPRSLFKRKLDTMNEESQSISMPDGETGIYSDCKTRLQASTEISKLPPIIDVPNPDNEIFLLRDTVLSIKIEVMNKDQSSSYFQHDKQKSTLEYFAPNLEESTISMKRQIIGDPSESGYTQFSSTKVSEGDELHSRVILNSEGRGYFAENMELLTSPTGNCQWPSMAEISNQDEMFFKLSISDVEAGKERDISNSSATSNKSQHRDPDADDSKSLMAQSLDRTLSFRDLALSPNVSESENVASQAGKLTRSESSNIGISENSTYQKRHLPTAPTATNLQKSRSEFERNNGTMDDESPTVSMMDVEAEIYSDHNTGLQASAEISNLPSITDASSPDNGNFLFRHVVLSNMNEVMDKDQSTSDFQHDTQKSRLESFGSRLEEIAISMKSQIIGDPSEIEHTQFSLSPKISDGDEMFFELSLSELEASWVRHVSNSGSPSNKSQPRDNGDPDADKSESHMVQSLHQTLSFRNPVVNPNILKSENAYLHSGKLIRPQSSKIGMCESSTSQETHSPTAPTGTKLHKSRSEFKRNVGTMNDNSQSVSMLDVETEIFSDHKTGLQASAEISKLPSIMDVSSTDNGFFLRPGVLSNKNEVMSKDQSNSDFQRDKQNFGLESFGTEMEESTISMKSQFIGDPSEIEYTHFSSSPKVSEGDERHSLVILNSEGREDSEENMEMRTSPTGHCGWPSIAESSHQSEMFFEFPLSDLEASGPQINIASKSVDRAIPNMKDNALKFNQDLDGVSASGKTFLASSSSGLLDQKGQVEWPCGKANFEILELLSSENDHTLDVLQCTCVDMDWKVCKNILFS